MGVVFGGMAVLGVLAFIGVGPSKSDWNIEVG